VPKRVEVPAEEASFVRRIGSRAGFVLAAIGLVFAAYQVQGWTMPRLLAALLIGLLLAVAAVALFSIVWEAIKEVQRWRERRETSTAWIAAEPPGMLDYVPDMKRASKKFVRQMSRLNRDTSRIGNQMSRDSRSIKLAVLFGPRAAQLWANHSARGILRSAVFIERRTDHLRATIAEFARAREGQLASLPAATNEEERAALAEARAAVAEQSATTAEAIDSVEGYRVAVLDVSQNNFSRTLRVSSHQLAEQLAAVIVVLRRSLKDSQRLEELFEEKARS
jgi:hypothetical protein